MLAAVVLCVAPGCQRTTISLDNLACDDGQCLDGYRCHPETGMCFRDITVSCDDAPGSYCPATTSDTDPCDTPGAFLPCTDRTDGCDTGCRTCQDDGTWSACSAGSCTIGQLNFCGDCRTDCTLDVQHATPICYTSGAAFVCAYEDSCDVGYGDADGDARNGCECAETNSAVEICDGIDNDCNGAYDDGLDVDMDGFTTCGTDVLAGGVDPSLVDCDDDPGACGAACNPGAIGEVCDGLDNDCSGAIDLIEIDADGDGYIECSGYVDNGAGFVGGDDCDGTDPDEFPGQLWYADCDADTFMRSASIVACDPPASPCADGLAPDGGWGHLDPGAVADCNDEDPIDFPSQLWFADCDGDTHFRTTAGGILSCLQPTTLDGTGCAGNVDPLGGWSNTADSDCDDESDTTYQGIANNELDPTACMHDADGDGYGDSAPGNVNVTPGSDVNDNATSCTTDDTTDSDGDGVPDCFDRCLDTDRDDYGDDNDTATIGTNADSVGACTSDGTNPCVYGDGPCAGTDIDDAASSCTDDNITDTDSDNVADCIDRCLDIDRDEYGTSNDGNIVGTGATVVGLCTSDGTTLCTFGDDACVDADIDDGASSCTDDAADVDGDGVPDCLDRCLDNDKDNYGTNNSSNIVGGGTFTVGTCTSNGTTPCVYGDAVCFGIDVNDNASSCTTNDTTDNDSDGVPDCFDRCRDNDRDDYGSSNDALTFGSNADTVGGCTSDGSTQCTYGDGPCAGIDVNDSASSCTDDNTTDTDNDNVDDCIDRCLDTDRDQYGTNNDLAVIGTGAVAVGLCTSDGTTACTFGDDACVDVDVDDAASSCTDDVADADNDGVMDCFDRCIDNDHDNYGTNNSGNTIGTGAVQVSACKTDGSTACTWGDATCTGADLDDNASSCTTNITTDNDGDGAPDCLDRCLDVDQDDYGADNSANTVGSGAITVGACTSDGMTPCTFADGLCAGIDDDDNASSCTDSTADSDGDLVLDCLDLCMDADLDDYGVDNSANTVGGGAITVGACTTNGSTPCTFGDVACTGGDLMDDADSCTDDSVDSDGDGVFDCFDLCLDVDLDDYGVDNSANTVGADATTVGSCTTDGLTACIHGDAACSAIDCDDDPLACGAACNLGVGGEICDEYDNNCDGNVDESCSGCVPNAFYCDMDGVTLHRCNALGTGSASSSGCVPDTLVCTVDCRGAACFYTPDESLCLSGEICNTCDDCVGTPGALTLSCDPALTYNTTPANCTIGLGTVRCEDANISCSADIVPTILFNDDGSTDPDANPDWATISGNPTIELGYLVADDVDWTIEASIDTSGMDVVCIEFDWRIDNENAGEYILVEFSTDGGSFYQEAVRIDFRPDTGPESWMREDLLLAWFGNICLTDIDSLAANNTDLRVRLRLASNASDDEVYVDNFNVIGFPVITRILLLDDPFDDFGNWTTLSGTPQLTTELPGGNSAAVADKDLPGLDTWSAYTSVDASFCDVVDLDFDLAFDNVDAAETIAVAMSTDGGSTWTNVMSIEFNVLDVDNQRRTWNRLMRLTDLDPAAAGNGDLRVRITLSSNGNGREVYLDNLQIICYDLPDPAAIFAIGALTDNDNGTYSFTVDGTSIATAELVCTWDNGSDPALSSSTTIDFTP